MSNFTACFILYGFDKRQGYPSKCHNVCDFDSSALVGFPLDLFLKERVPFGKQSPKRVEIALFIQSVEDAPLFHLLKTLWKVCKTCLLMGFSTVSTEFSTAVVEKFST